MDYSCTARLTEGRVTLTVAGDVDLAAHGRFLAEAETWTTHTNELVLDCSEVTFLDSMGLQALVRLRNLTVQAGHAFYLRAPSRAVTRVVELSGLVGHFPRLDILPEERPATPRPIPGAGPGRHRGPSAVAGGL